MNALKKTKSMHRGTFSISVSSPTFQEFAKNYLGPDGTIRPDIYEKFIKVTSVKGIKVAYDKTNRRWGFDVIANDVQTTAKNPFIASMPCRIFSSSRCEF